MMHQVSLRDFRRRGAKVLQAVPRGETVLLSGQDGPAFFLVPVMGDVAAEDRELRRAMAKARLRENWKIASATLVPLEDTDIDEEVSQIRLASVSR